MNELPNKPLLRVDECATYFDANLTVNRVNCQEEERMEKTKNCLDCLHCKLINRRQNLTCKAGQWLKNDGEAKHIILQGYEVRTLNIKSRDIFQNAIRCDQMISMD